MELYEVSKETEIIRERLDALRGVPLTSTANARS
jgi:hypothetical protein